MIAVANTENNVRKKRFIIFISGRDPPYLDRYHIAANKSIPIRKFERKMMRYVVKGGRDFGSRPLLSIKEKCRIHPTFFVLVGNKGLSSCSSQDKSFGLIFCLARSGGHSLKSCQVKARFLNALGSRPLLRKEKGPKLSL